MVLPGMQVIAPIFQPMPPAFGGTGEAVMGLAGEPQEQGQADRETLP